MTVRWRRWDQERRARGAVGRRAASSTASLIRLRGVIIKSMGNAWSMSALQAHYGRVTIVLGSFVILFAVEGFVIPSYLEE
jgi:hypothetical protein